MPGVIDNEGSSSLSCRKCGGLPSSTTVRGDRICQDCFTSFVQTKVVKKLTHFSVRHAALEVVRKLLLPISPGASSISLLYILDEHLKRQLSRTGRTGFELHVLHVNDSDECDHVAVEASMTALKKRFPRHTYSIKRLQNLEVHGDLPDRDSTYDGPFAAGSNSLSSASNGSPCMKLSATSHADMLEVARTRTLAEEARRLGCESILWGHSTTRLAEKLLAETAKGRGFALPWFAHDGPSPFGVDFLFPMRDVLKKELRGYCNRFPDDVKELCNFAQKARPPTSTKAKTIDGLMKEYFESVEESYPSIVTNVMRTSGKLAGPAIGETVSCRMCNMPVSEDALGTSNWAGVQEAGASHVASETTSEGAACYGCATALLDLKKTGG